jgi:hypothetical protein
MTRVTYQTIGSMCELIKVAEKNRGKDFATNLWMDHAEAALPAVVQLAADYESLLAEVELLKVEREAAIVIARQEHLNNCLPEHFEDACRTCCKLTVLEVGRCLLSEDCWLPKNHDLGCTPPEGSAL